MYILISKNNFDGTKKYEYSSYEEALRAYETTRGFLIKMPFGPSYELILYKDSVHPKNELKRCVIAR